MTDQDCSTRPGKPKGNGDMEIRRRGLQALLRNWDRMENGPAGVLPPVAGADHAPTLHQIEGEVSNILPSLAGLTDSERRIRLLHLLEDADQRLTAARVERRSLMVAARDAGVSCRNIGIALGISEQTVREQTDKAKARAVSG